MSEESKATNGLSRVTKVFGTVISGLILAGVVGIVVMAKEQAVIATTVVYIKESLESSLKRIDGLDSRVRDIEIGTRGGGYPR